jgi:hypothetical protein
LPLPISITENVTEKRANYRSRGKLRRYVTAANFGNIKQSDSEYTAKERPGDTAAG